MIEGLTVPLPIKKIQQRTFKQINTNYNHDKLGRGKNK